MTTTSTIDTMSMDVLKAYARKLEIDPAFGCYNRGAGELNYPTVKNGYAVVFIDIANMHALNHKYTMAIVDEFIANVINVARDSDIVYRHGGDEIVCVVPAADVNGFVDRLDSVMSDNNLYGVYGIVYCNKNTAIQNAVKRGDELVMAVKAILDANGSRPDRNALYVKYDSVRVYSSLD
jgi:GGDEF domain-containing protein